MYLRLLIWIGTLIILIKENNGYVRTYADEYYGRIRGSNQATAVNPAIIFLIIFGCIVGGFFIFCILGTLFFGIFDNGFRRPIRLFLHRNISSNSNINSSTPSIKCRL